MSDLRTRILEHILPLVPFDGWSGHALSLAAKQANISALELKQAFPGGAADCLDYFFESADATLAREFPETMLKEKRVPERIETLLMARLGHFALHREAVRRAVAHRALPWNAPAALRSLYRTVDVMWKLAGDSATDFSFYTKRATLAGLYTSALMYWLNDASENSDNTKEFIRRRLSDIAAFGKRKKAFKDKLKVA
jgi:ubiquinone biosynthesis protein COQ9